MSLPLLHAGKSAAGLSAALDLRFALDKSLTAYRGPTPSFSRASTGSYFDGSGVLRYAALNQVLYSEDFGNAAWVKQNGTISTDQIIAPDGKTTADKFTENVANTFFNIYNSSAVSHSAGATMTASGYFKYGTRRYIQFILGPAAAGVSVVVDLLNGLITATGSSGAASYTSSSITNAGNGWYRVSVTGTLPSANTGYYDLFTSNTSSFVNPYPTFSSSGEYTYIWGAQVETGSTVGTYCPTTSSANSAPRFDHTYNGTSWVSRGLLMEEQRTNSAQYSEDFTNAYWTKAGLSVSGNNANAPDGNLTADKFVETAANSQHTLYNSGFSVTTGTAYIISFFAKAAGRNFIQFPLADVMTGVGSNGRVNFDLSTGTIGQVVGTNLTAEIIDVGNGWYRCVVKLSSAASNGTGYLQFNLVNSATATPGQAYLGDGTSGVLVWGIQLEAGSAFATSYIPSLSNSSTTRSADVCQITGSDFSSFWNASEGSFAVEYDSLPPSGLASWYGYPFQASNGGSTHRMMVGNDSQNNQQLWLVQDSVGQSIISSGSFFSNAGGKLSCCYKINDLAMSVNGSAVVTDLSQGISSLINQIRIGDANDGATNRNINGHISRLRYFNKRLTDKQLEDLCRPEEQLKLDLKFSENLSLTPVAGPAPSFSRASTGTYFNASGVLTSASINTPRFDHVFSGGKWVSKGLLLEEQRTNSQNWSEDFTNAFWTKSSASISANSSTSPDGNLTADKLVENSSNAYHNFYDTGFLPSSGQSITLSIFVKSSGRQFVQFYPSGGLGSGYANFDIVNGILGSISGTGITASIQNAGNGWFRCSMTQSSCTAATAYFQFGIIPFSNSVQGAAYLGDGNSGVFIFGAMRESGSFPTSYIPTTTTSVVRSADVCQITGADFSGFYNQSEGSIIVEFDTNAPSVPLGTSGFNTQVAAFRDSGNNRRIYIGTENFSGRRFYIDNRSGSSSTISPGAIIGNGVLNKASCAYRVDDIAASFDGGSILTDNAQLVPTVITLVDFGTSPANDNYLCGHISRLRYYAIRLPNRLLIAKSQ